MLRGRDAIIQVQNEARVETFDIPDTVPDQTILAAEAPLEGDVYVFTLYVLLQLFLTWEQILPRY